VLPVKATAALRRTVGREPLSPTADRLDGVRLLVVDDQEDERQLLATLVTYRGAEVRTAQSADAAVSTLAEWQPDLMVSDIAMPDEDGYALLRRVRDLRGQASHLPAIALTAHAALQDQERALPAGFQGYLPKPVEPVRLVRAIIDRLPAGRT
jgi:CheY-like chemotaxis protein